MPTRLLRSVGQWLLRGPRRRALRHRITARLGSGEIVVPRGRLKGMRLTITGSNPGYALGVSEPAVQEALERTLQPGSVMFDVGANIGFLALAAAPLVGPTGHVYAFEPLRENAEMLRHNLARNGAHNVTVLEVALGARSGTGHMEVPSSADGTLIAELVMSDADAVGHHPVAVECIDELVKARRCRPPDLVKIDVEGAEVGVLTGMREVLQSHAPVVVCEVHDPDRDSELWRTVRDLLERAGYRASELEQDAVGGMGHLLAVPAAARG